MGEPSSSSKTSARIPGPWTSDARHWGDEGDCGSSSTPPGLMQMAAAMDERLNGWYYDEFDDYDVYDDVTTPWDAAAEPSDSSDGQWDDASTLRSGTSDGDGIEWCELLGATGGARGARATYTAPKPDDVPLGPPAKKKKGAKGLPKGICDHRTGMYRARLTLKDNNEKTVQRFIPGLFKTIEEAVAAQAVAAQKLQADGPQAVWPLAAAPTERKPRGQGSKREQKTAEAAGNTTSTANSSTKWVWCT